MRMNFANFQKPSRYIDNEFNVIKKDGPLSVRFALAFPDTYEVGMSHLGLRMLYDIINGLPFAAAERVFAPWTDMHQYLKKEKVHLASLESGTPLAEFDIVGFSLQYELSYTTVLDMLDLASIPLRTAERMTFAKPLPLIVAGGPSTVNPAPMSPFIDAFLIGDGEEAIVELSEVVNLWKAGGGSREELLQKISLIEGFYVPVLHKKSMRVKRRFIKDLDAASFPEHQIVPYTQIVHDRISIEVARGCTMGCRFCQAGVIYRPLRERSPERVLEIAERALNNTGYDEVSFASLSAGDYSCLLPLITAFNSKYRSSRIAVALPSLRVASVDKAVLNEIKSVRKTGFTMAPEAATERLRSVINKDFTDNDYERALHALFDAGWLTLKLYFMIGLPTEHNEDLEAINEMAMKALRIAKGKSGKFVNINITVSPFIPKPHTPFQWYGQISLEDMRQKLAFLRHSINAKKFKYKGHNEEMSFLEAVFARGDEKLADLIETAWRLGCRLDGWTEFFDFSKWMQAMEAVGINGAAYAEKIFAEDDPLPWDQIDVGVEKPFLYNEYRKAIEGKTTADCRKACTACGLKCKEAGTTAEVRHTESRQNGSANQPVGCNIKPKVRVRVEFSKTGSLRYLSHLELLTAITRALRRANIPFDYSKGFHPKPSLSFGPPLNVGVAGLKEYFDMEVFTPFDVELYGVKLNGTLPEGLKIARMSIIEDNRPSLTGFVTRYEYVIGVRKEVAVGVDTAAPNLPGAFGNLLVQRESKEVDIRPCVESVKKLEIVNGHFRRIFGHDLVWAFKLVLRDQDDVKIRLSEISEVLFGMKKEELSIVRMRMFGREVGIDEWKEPL